MVQTIRARERRTVELGEHEYRLLEESSTARSLIEEGIISLVRSKTTPFGVRAGAFVGEAIVTAQTRLIIDEKVSGSLRAMLRWAVADDIRSAHAASMVDTENPVLEVFAREFLDALALYLRRGRIKAYVPAAHESAIVRGRLDVPRSMRLDARGHHGMVAYRRRTLSADLNANRLLGLALSAVDSLVRVGAVGTDIATRARTYSALFEDVSWLSLRRRLPTYLDGLFLASLVDQRSTADLRRALSYARALVLNLGAWPDEDSGRQVPDSFFLNLETLFEDAVRRVLGTVAQPDEVARGSTLKRPLFRERPGVYVADPDFVLRHVGTVRLVGDTKYKDLEGLPGHSDVYQLAAHIHAIGTSLGLLVYPGDMPSVDLLGTTNSGASVWFCTARLLHLEPDLRECLRRLTSQAPAEPALA